MRTWFPGKAKFPILFIMCKGGRRRGGILPTPYLNCEYTNHDSKFTTFFGILFPARLRLPHSEIYRGTTVFFRTNQSCLDMFQGNPNIRFILQLGIGEFPNIRFIFQVAFTGNPNIRVIFQLGSTGNPNISCSFFSQVLQGTLISGSFFSQVMQGTLISGLFFSQILQTWNLNIRLIFQLGSTGNPNIRFIFSQVLWVTIEYQVNFSVRFYITWNPNLWRELYSFFKMQFIFQNSNFFFNSTDNADYFSRFAYISVCLSVCVYVSYTTYMPAKH